MAQPYVGEIRMFAGNFAPAGWMFCEGQVLSVAEHDVLFNLIGTTYGGDGQETFQLPDMRGRIPIHQGASVTGTTYPLAMTGGVESITLTTGQIPQHSHPIGVRLEQGDTSNPDQAALALSTLSPYTAAGAEVSGSMHAGAVTAAGSSQPHNNMMPYLCVHFIISLFGIYPSQT
ncbi:phage tail protein [Paenibacillus sp. GCM10012303]|jgi:microcystin-dependent protein|uniref:phage tail protein n=1 Tax=Paenibacillus sp. GCM10012303 TaxID=3317340 RepID=UPI003614B5B5